MAKRGGFFGTIGSLWRLTIWGLAAILVVAVWIWYTREEAEDVVATSEATSDATVEAEDAAPELPGRAEETPESVAEKEAGTPVPDAADTGGADLPQGTGLAETRESDGSAVEISDSDGTGGASQPQPDATDQSATASGAAADPARIPMPDQMTTINVIGDSTAIYAFVDAVRVDGGAIELTTVRTEDGTTAFVTRRVLCDPLSAVVIAEGTARDIMTERKVTGDPEPVEAGSPEAALASYACSLDI